MYLQGNVLQLIKGAILASLFLKNNNNNISLSKF